MGTGRFSDCELRGAASMAEVEDIASDSGLIGKHVHDRLLIRNQTMVDGAEEVQEICLLNN